MNRSSGVLFVSSLLGFASVRASASTPTCVPVQLLGDAAALSEEYRVAIDALVEATSHPGKPWSCAGGTMSVVMAPNGRAATLTLVDASGRTATRPVEGPEDLRAVVEALLAAPLADDPPASPPKIETQPLPIRPIEAPPGQNAPLPLPTRSEPRLLIEALGGPRGSSPFPTAWMAGELRGTVPLDSFRVGVWARLALPVAYEHRPPRHFNMQEVNFGISIGRVLIHGPFELTARFDPSFAVVTAEAGRESDPDHDEDEEGARVGLRLGLGLMASLRVNRFFRAVLALDGNIAPIGIANNPPIAADLPVPPVYGFGLALGAEAAIP